MDILTLTMEKEVDQGIPFLDVLIDNSDYSYSYYYYG